MSPFISIELPNTTLFTLQHSWFNSDVTINIYAQNKTKKPNVLAILMNLTFTIYHPLLKKKRLGASNNCTGWKHSSRTWGDHQPSAITPTAGKVTQNAPFLLEPFPKRLLKRTACNAWEFYYSDSIKCCTSVIDNVLTYLQSGYGCILAFASTMRGAWAVATRPLPTVPTLANSRTQTVLPGATPSSIMSIVFGHRLAVCSLGRLEINVYGLRYVVRSEGKNMSDKYMTVRTT